jgi:hypothetical protein
MRVRLRIESLAIEGLDLQPHQEPALRAALSAELARLFAIDETFRGNYTRRLTARMLDAADSRPERLGRQIGRAVHGSVTRHAQ